MENETLKAVINVKKALDEVKKHWMCPGVNDVTQCICDDCEYSFICLLDFNIRRDLDTLYYELLTLKVNYKRKEVQTMQPAYLSVYENQTITEKDLNTIGIETEGIHFEDRVGKWHMVDVLTCYNEESTRQTLSIFGLFEHDYYGDSTELILAWFDWLSGDCNWKEIGGTYDDIQTSLIDWDIIDVLRRN